MTNIGDVITVNITSLASTGKGVGTVDVNGFKRSVFVPLTVPEDVCHVKISKIHKKYYEAELVSLISPSKHRVKPNCEFFGICGACNWLHINYDYQVEAKKTLLEFLFFRAKIPHPNIEVIKSTHPNYYRHKVRMPLKDGRFGYYKRQSNEIVQVSDCKIIRQEFNTLFEKDNKLPDGEYTYIYDYDTQKIISQGSGFYSYGDIIYEYNAQSFVQSNLYQNKFLIDEVLAMIPAECKILLELYCGIGNFTLPIAKRVKNIIAVEGNSVDLLKKNMERNKIANIEVHHTEVRDFIDSSKKYDCVVLDPPRCGIGEDIFSLNTKTIIYVSCDPSFLMKDLKGLVGEGFKIEKVKIIDMFSQTHQYETIVLLKKI